MSIRPLYTARCLLLAIMTFVAFTAAYGQDDEVKIKNTVRQIRSGLYECVVYFEISRDLSERIEEVTYTLPYGYPNRKHGVKRRGATTINGFFSSKPIVTAEEIIINIKIEYEDDRDDVYLSYKLNPFKADSR